MTALFISILFGGPTLMLFIMVIMGCVELMTTRRLRKYGERIEGQLEDVDLKSARPGGVYGKVRFTYRVQERTYTKKQTVNKDTGIALLSRLPAFPLLSGPPTVIVLFLSKRPSLARLAIAPSDRMRMVNFVVALIVLGCIVALILVVVLAPITTQPNY